MICHGRRRSRPGEASVSRRSGVRHASAEARRARGSDGRDVGCEAGVDESVTHDGSISRRDPARTPRRRDGISSPSRLAYPRGVGAHTERRSCVIATGGGAAVTPPRSGAALRSQRPSRAERPETAIARAARGRCCFSPTTLRTGISSVVVSGSCSSQMLTRATTSSPAQMFPPGCAPRGRPRRRSPAGSPPRAGIGAVSQTGGCRAGAPEEAERDGGVELAAAIRNQLYHVLAR